MKRTAFALAASAVATLATVGIVRVTSSSETAPKFNDSQHHPNTSVNPQLIDQAGALSEQRKEAQAELARATHEYASDHAGRRK